MKPASPALIALLATRQFFAADLYEFALIDGTMLYYCGGDKDIVWNSQTWSSGGAGANSGPFFDRKDNKAKCHWKVGVEVDTLVFDCIPGGAQVEGISFLSAVREGIFDGAELTLYRAFMPTYGNVAAGTVIMFVGRVAEIDASRSLATFSINSHLELLNQNMPRNLYQAPCVNTLYDGPCTLSQNNFSATGAAQAGSTASTVLTLFPNPTDYFTFGQITFTSGANNGVTRTVKQYTNNGVNNPMSVVMQFPNVPAAGDTFIAYAGCDKSFTTCTNRFSNPEHFRGFPFVPDSNTSI